MAEISGQGIPTNQTAAAIGDIYTDTDTGQKYKCDLAYASKDEKGNDLTYYIWIKLKKESSGSGGTTDYTNLTNKPQINSVDLVGNKTSADLSLIDGTAFNKLKEDLGNLTIPTKNILDQSDMRVGYCASNGNIDATETNYKYTYNYTEVNAGDVLWIHTDNKDVEVSGARFVAAYDKNKIIMPSIGANAASITSYIVPSGVKYLRFTFYKDDSEIMVNSGEKQLPYEPYGRYVDWKSLRNVPLENTISDSDTSFLSASVIYDVFNDSFQKKRSVV